MIIQYLGTGGGAGIPEIFCNCRICKNARKSREKDIRYRPLAIINHELCIDFPCDVRENILRHNINSGEIHWILITHNHYDHLNYKSNAYLL